MAFRYFRKTERSEVLRFQTDKCALYLLKLGKPGERRSPNQELMHHVHERSQASFLSAAQAVGMYAVFSGDFRVTSWPPYLQTFLTTGFVVVPGSSTVITYMACYVSEQRRYWSFPLWAQLENRCYTLTCVAAVSYSLLFKCAKVACIALKSGSDWMQESKGSFWVFGS